jgi:hypothetical protein
MMTIETNQVSDTQVHARSFDETNAYWEKKPEYNLLFLKNTQNYFNDLLNSRGHVFLNEVYDRLGFKRTPAGQVVGWLRSGKGAGYIDFAIHDEQKSSTPSVSLDFNVDGIIYDQI